MMDRKKEQKKLDSLAGEYDKTYLTGVEKRHIEIQAKYVSKFCKGKILEMGVGGATWLDVMMEKFLVVDVVDASEKLLLECKKTYDNKVNIFLSLFEDFVPEEKYDTVNMGHILEHVYNPIEILQLAGQWLKKDGIINIVVPHAGSIHRRLGVLMGLNNSIVDLNTLDRKVGHRRVYTIESFREHIWDAGLRIVIEQGLFLKVINNARMEYWEGSLIKGLFELGFQVPIEFSGSLFFQCGI